MVKSPWYHVLGAAGPVLGSLPLICLGFLVACGSVQENYTPPVPQLSYFETTAPKGDKLHCFTSEPGGSRGLLTCWPAPEGTATP